MTGYDGEDAGIIPRFCKELFQRIQSDQIVSVTIIADLPNSRFHVYLECWGLLLISGRHLDGG